MKWFERHIPFLSRYRLQFVAIVCSVWAFYLRFRWLVARPTVDGDDSWQLMIMQEPFWRMVGLLKRHEHGGLLSLDYFLIWPFYQVFGRDKFGLALPHLLVTVLGFYFFYLLAKKYLRTTWGHLLAFLIVAYNLQLIKYSILLRVYAVLPTLAMMSLYFSDILFSDFGRLSKTTKFGFGAFFVLLIWFHVYGIVILSCTALFNILRYGKTKEFRENLKGLSVFVLVVLVVGMSLWLYSVFGPHLEFTRESAAARFMNTFDYIPNPLINLVGFLKGIFGNLLGERRFYPFLVGVLIPFVVPYSKRFFHIAFFCILIVLPLQLLLQGVLQTNYWFIQRQFTWVMPFFALYLALCWEGLFEFIQGKLKRE